MKSSFQGMRALATGIAAGAVTGFWGVSASAEVPVGQPVPGGIAMVAGATPMKLQAIWFHNYILLPIITAIVLLVLGLLVWCVLRYNKRANPVPARWSHNTPVEVIWTLMPVLILVFIAFFSFRLLFAYHDMPKPDLTIKATGYQWYWGYEYPDQKIPEYVSNLMPEDQAKAKGLPYRLAADDPLVVPVNKTVRVLVTGADVIHSFAVPSFGVIMDAVPGKVNETWFKVNKVGTYYGQCRELCGVNHAFMPIMVRVVSQADFNAWVASKHGTVAAATPTTLAAVANAAGGSNTPPGSNPPAAAAAPNNPAAPAPAAAPAKPAAPAATSPAPTAPAAH